MSYTKRTLIAGEKFIYEAHCHWLFAIRPFIWATLSFLLFIAPNWSPITYLSLLTQRELGLILDAGFQIASVVFLGITLLSLVRLFFVRSSWEFAVTDKRVVVRAGFFRRDSLDLLMKQIESITIRQGILGRLFGYGVVEVRGSGGTKARSHIISKPLEIRHHIQNHIM